MGPYPAFVSLLQRHAGEIELAIATAKDATSVHALLRAYGIASLSPPDRVVDKEAGRSKVAHLGILAERTGCTYAEMLFFDDKVNHLDSVAELGVACALASWGYNGPREEALARARGYRVFGVADVERHVFG